MGSHIYWFVLSLVLLAAELASGTFYMLVLAVALAAGGFAALAGAPAGLDFAVAAFVGVAGVAVLRRWRARQTPAATALQDLDVGQPVEVIGWRDDGTARVRYRGAEWDAELVSADTPHTSPLYIAEVRGVRLALTHHKP
jgi:membrane protein implicated in regulation of membrane protease activity